MFIDSVVWIGAKLERDQWHKKARDIIKKFLYHEIELVYVTDYVVLETVNFILRKAGFKHALETLNIFRMHSRIKIVNIDDKLFNETCKLFEKYPELSFTDASIIAAMRKLKIKEVYSFDKAFDRVEDIIRLE